MNIKAIAVKNTIYGDPTDQTLRVLIVLGERVTEKDGKIVAYGTPESHTTNAGSEYPLRVSKALFKEMETMKAHDALKKHFNFTIKNGIAESITIADSPENASRKQVRTASQALEIEIEVSDKGRKVTGIPEDFDLSTADSIRDRMPQNLEDLKTKDKINNHSLLRIVDEGEIKTYVFKAIP